MLNAVSSPAPIATSRAASSRRRWRVLHVIDSLDLGGAQGVLINLIKHGDRDAFEFEAACLHGRGVYWQQLRDLGIRTSSLSFDHRFPSYVPALAWMCLTRRYDIVHTHLLASNVIAKPIAAFCGVPVRINHDHCNDKLADPRRWAPKADALTNRFSTHVIAVSQSAREFVVKEEGVPESRATTIHNGIDLETFQPRPERRREARARLGLPQDAFVVAGIGRLTFQKNFALFVEVAAAVRARNPRADFVIAGTGEDEPALRAQAARLGCADAVHFLGYVGDMPALYPAVDVLMLTSRYEGPPITILEAMATGAAIVSAKLDGVQEILRDEVDAALVTPGDATEFAARLNQLLADEPRRERYAQAALEKVRASYSAAAMTRAVEAIYRRCLAAAAVSPR